MEPADGARSFLTSGDAYDSFMGRYSRPLAHLVADAAGVTAGQRALDIGCGPGALTAVLVERLGGDHVAACDPSQPFVTDCAARHPGVDVRVGRAEQVPFADHAYDRAIAQLVLHFVSDVPAAMGEMQRVLAPGGRAAACVWADGGQEMLTRFWDAARAIDPDAATEVMRFGLAGELTELFETAGFADVTETTLEVRSTYDDFDELWAGYVQGVGPAGAFCRALPEAKQTAVRRELHERLGSPTGSFSLTGLARFVCGDTPG
ncbi:MAG: class I SAM-dependent methyltransferase [Actinobacteria bacterium]|nr:class I SAM-dependent methyltransferase [Actinomycetota bacterium]